MQYLIMIIVLALFMVLIRFKCLKLNEYDQTQKTLLCTIVIIVSLIITSILFSISQKGIEYSNIEAMKRIKMILIAVFTPINGITFMPFFADILTKIKNSEIDQQEETKRIIKLAIILLVIFIIETKYLKSIQLGIIDVANKM